jgi:hypothetical protein
MEMLAERIAALEISISELQKALDEMGARLRKIPDNAEKMALFGRWREMTIKLADIAIEADAVLWE